MAASTDDDPTTEPRPDLTLSRALGPASSGRFDELRGRLAEPGAPLAAVVPVWRQFFEALHADGAVDAADIASRAARVQRRVREDGATYHVHGAGTDAVHAWPLQPLPLLLSAAEWPAIEAGVAQRARMFNATLADIYGGQTLLREAVLPPSLVFAHPQYLRPMHGVTPPGGVYLHVAAFDLARGPEGRWWVLAQRLQAPSGLGYLLENRLIVAQEMHEAFAALRVQRVGASFQRWLGDLRALSPAGERARVVLLTPGPLHETYFEQVFLARYLGLTLVEASDLTVRDRQLFLKTMQGLERVHVVLRRVDDEWLDPLELRADSALGVPGLLQALRAGELVLANAPGAGVLESPGLAAFWPGVAERLLGEELLLPASTHWWCGEDSVWRAQRTRLADFVVAPTFPQPGGDGGVQPMVAAYLDPMQRAALAGRIDAEPAAYTLQARVRPSETPAWEGGNVEPRPVVLRVFALADGRGGWQVLPGGMARVAGRRDRLLDPWLSMQHGSASADTWVIADGDINPASMLRAPLSAGDLQAQQRTVTSRAAENLFWLGRYTERSEFVVSLARLTLESLRSAGEPVRALLGELAGWHGLVPEGTPSPTQSLRVFERALVHALPASAGCTSVGFNLRAVVDCAEALRERLSPDHWRLIQDLDNHFEQHMAAVLSAAGDGGVAPVADALGLLGRTSTHLSAETGAQADRMVRDDGWRLQSVGRQIERLDTLCHALARGLELRLHESDEGFALLLSLADSLITYRARFQARREPMPLLHLLVFDTDNPRSLAWVSRTMRERLRKLARHDAAWADEMISAAPAPELWSLEACAAFDADGVPRELVRLLHGCVEGVRTLADAISRRLFVHVSDHSIWQ